MKLTRRDLLVWSAGAAAGLLATPVPWKVLDDISIRSQNWPWIPQPARGPVENKRSFCTLCPKGCGLRLRMAAGWPVGVAGSKTHPITHGALCPLAFAAHQLNWHPQRLRRVHHQSSNSSWPEARNAFAKACNEGPIVIFDGYPGRAASAVLESFAEKHGGYVAVPSREARGLLPYERWTGVPADCLAYDLENTKTIVSFGSPLLDGWGSPGRFTRLWADRAAGMTDPQLRLIQVDSSLTRTAARAWRWIRISEGSETSLASGLARALLEQNLVAQSGPLPPVSVADSAAQAGLSPEEIRELARVIATNSPTLVIASNDNPSIAALNVLLGSVGARGGIVRRSGIGTVARSCEASVQRPRAVVIDASVPWEFVPQMDGEVFRFAAWDGGPTNADWLLPAPGFLEELTDVPTAPGCSIETYAVAAKLLEPASEIRGAAQFLADLDPHLTPAEKIIDARCEGLLRRRTGFVHAIDATPIRNFDSVQKLKDQLWNGAVWAGEPAPPGNLRCELKGWPHEQASGRAAAWDDAWTAPVMPTLATKLFREADLREIPGRRFA